MPLTVTESLAVNTLLRWLVALPNEATGQVPTSEQARSAAELLCDHASKSLGAGLQSHEVAAKWSHNRR